MSYRLTAVTLALLAFGAPAPVRADDTDADRLKVSLAKWEKAREACGGDYAIEVRWSSAFGFGNRTVVTVAGNKVVKREYHEFGRPEPVKPGEKPAEPKAKWVETGKDIGTHKEGAPARTVDELYADAAKVLEAKRPETHQLHLGFDKDGVLNYCFTRDTRIADDAPKTGVAPFQLQLKATK